MSIAWLVNFFAEGTLLPEGYAEQTGFYVNIALAALGVLSLSALRPGPRARRIDAVLGHLSYPVFLVQWLGGLAGYMLLSSKIPRGWELVLASTPIILILAAALTLLNARFVEPLRWRPGYRELKIGAVSYPLLQTIKCHRAPAACLASPEAYEKYPALAMSSYFTGLR